MTAKSEGTKSKRPKPIGFLLIFLSTLAMVVLPGLADDTCKAATDSPEVQVGSELDFPPYAFVDENGQPVGFSVDLIRAVADTMGMPITISTGPWDTVWNGLVAGRLNVLPIVAKSQERQLLVDFSLPHTETFDAFFVREGDPPIPNIEAARGKGIVVMRSDAAHHELVGRKFEGRLFLVDTIPEGLSLIASGKHDAFLCSKLIGTMVIKTHRLKTLSAGPPIADYKRVFSFAVKKGDTELLEKLNQGLLIIKTNGDYDRIYERWLAADDPWRKWQKYLMPTIATGIGAALILGLWVVMLRLQVSKRTRELCERNAMLLKARESLEERVAQRTAELEKANSELQIEVSERERAEEAVRESEERLQKENREIALLNRILRIFAEADGNELFERVLEIVQEGVASRHGVFGYIAEPGHLMCPSLSKMLDECEVKGKCIHYPPEKWKGLWARSLLEKRSFYTNEPPAVPHGHPAIRNNLTAPILFRGEVIGLLNLANKESGYAETDRALLESMAERIAPLLYAWIQKKLREDERAKAEEALRESETRFRNLYENMVEGVALHEIIYEESGKASDYRIVSVNPAFERHTGLKAEQVEGGLASIVYGTGEAPHIDHYARVAESGRPFAFETFFPPMQRHFSISVSSPGQDQFVTVFEDISERKQMEEKLRKSLDELELRVQERTAELQDSNRALMEYASKLERLNEELQDFVFVASHDLQEPLRKIQTFCDMAITRCAPAMDDTGQEYLVRVARSATRMRQLLSDLLEFSRVAARPEPFKETDLGRIAREAADLFQESLKESGGLVEIENMPLINADEGQMLRLFQNLIGNASKYRSEKSPLIKIYARNDGRRCEIFVEDNGIGFDQQFAERIFRPFQRLHGRNRYEGTGIGLAICRKIVDWHGGSIRAESEPGKGSRFIVVLPVKHARKEGIE